ADPVEAIKPYPMRMARMRSSKTAPPIAAVPLGHSASLKPDVGPASASPALPEEADGPALSEHAEGPVPPAVSQKAQSSAATAEPVVSRAKRWSGATHARRRRDDETENARWQSQRWRSWGERAYAEDRYWRGAYRSWVY